MPRHAYFEDAFFAVLERTGGEVTRSAELAGVSKQAVYYRRDRDPQFRQRLEETLGRVRQGNRDAAERRFERSRSSDRP